MTILTHEFTAELPASRERVFQALTEESDLVRWFAEHVEVEPRAGGAFRFWGRHTQGTPVRAEATQKLTRFEPPAVLAFTWRIEGCDSEVTLELSVNGSGAPAGAAPGESVAAASTLLKGRHHFAQAPDVPRAPELIEDLWRMAMANLNAWLLGGKDVWLADFSDPVPRIRQSILIDAPRDAVFHALLDPATLNKWIASNAVVEPKVGGRYSCGWQYEVRGKQVNGGPTKILELVDCTKLVTDWPDWRGDPDMPTQQVSWVLESVGEQTRVFLIHDPFQRTADISDYSQGWAAFLRGLKAQAEALVG